MLHIYFQSKLIILILLFTSICNVQCAQHPAIHFEIETDQPCQTMDYFGASDCWSMQFIGLWPQEKQNQVADWLFSTENHENGQPKGIGLSLWRFNVGAGSAEQGAKPRSGDGERIDIAVLLPEAVAQAQKDQHDGDRIDRVQDRDGNV